MARTNQYLHPARQPARPLEAATVLLLRDGADGALEVLMTRRSAQASFAPGAYVFPGGASTRKTAPPMPWPTAARRRASGN